MRVINVEEISKNIKEMCIEANYYLSDDMKNALYKAAEQEENPLGCQILNQLKENLDIADSNLSRYRDGSCICRGRPGCTY